MSSDQFTDQAAGLRRLLHAAPPEVLAVLTCCPGSNAWLAAQLRARALAGARLLALEECLAAGNLADCLGVSPRFDLRMVVEGSIPLAAALVEAVPGLDLAQVGALAAELGQDRVFNQRCLAQLRALRADWDEWMIVAPSAELRSLSQLTCSAPRLLLVMDARPMSVTTAYASLKRLAACGGERHVAVCMTQALDERSAQVLDNFCATVLHRLDLPLSQVSCLGEALALGAREGGVSADAFIERLVQTTSGVTRLRGRVPG